MKHVGDGRSKFLNHRQWRDFMSAVHESMSTPVAISYPKVINALRTVPMVPDDDSPAISLAPV
jgi:hypothetical protein